MEYKFMQIYGNCAATHYLGSDRIRGPVDNVVTKGLPCLKMVLNGTYYDSIVSAIPTEYKREPGFDGDSAIGYTYDFVEIIHENPNTEKYHNGLLQRCQNLADFKQKVLTDPNYYFTYSLNQWDLNKPKHKLKGTILEDNIKYLKTLGLLDKTIFVGTVGKNNWNFWSNDMAFLIKKYNLKYLEIIGMIGGIVDNTPIVNQFNQKVLQVITYGTDKRYLQERDLNGKPIVHKKLIKKHDQKKPLPDKNKSSYLNLQNYFGL